MLYVGASGGLGWPLQAIEGPRRTNQQNIPPLHDLDVIVWLGGVVPTTGFTAAVSGGRAGGEVAFNPPDENNTTC